jgi:hypothetical protein
MGKTILFILLFALFFILPGCKTRTIYLPVESTKTEYRDNYLRDSIVSYDSIFIKEKDDTVWLEKYKYIYKDRIARDSIFINDTIKVPYPVEVPGPEVYKITGWQNFQIWLGRLFLLVTAGYLGIRYLKKKFFH